MPTYPIVLEMMPSDGCFCLEYVRSSGGLGWFLSFVCETSTFLLLFAFQLRLTDVMNAFNSVGLMYERLNLDCRNYCSPAPCGLGVIPLFPCPFTYPLSHLLLYLLVPFTFPFSLSYSLHLIYCFSIPSPSTRIVSLHFQAGCRRRRLNPALFFSWCWFYVICILYLTFLSLFGWLLNRKVSGVEINILLAFLYWVGWLSAPDLLSLI